MFYNLFCRLFVEPCPFIHLEQERQLLFPEELLKRTVIDDGIADCARNCVKPRIYLIPSMDGVNVWCHTDYLARQTAGILHLLQTFQSESHLPCRWYHYVGIGTIDDLTQTLHTYRVELGPVLIYMELYSIIQQLCLVSVCHQNTVEIKKQYLFHILIKWVQCTWWFQISVVGNFLQIDYEGCQASGFHPVRRTR